jgi:hypothetical protein
MTEFDARIVKLNQRSDAALDKVVKGCETRVDKNMVDRVLRPFIHIMNECEVNNVNTDNVFDAMVSIMVAMSSEYFMRTLPKNNSTMLADSLGTLFDEFSEGMVGAIAANFGVVVELSSAATPAPTGSPLQQH